MRRVRCIPQAHEMLDFVCDAVMSTDIESNITYMNRAAEKLSGFSRQEALGRPLQEIFQVIDMNTRPDLAHRSMDTDCGVDLHIDSYLITRQGLELVIESSETALHNANQEVIGALVIFHDARSEDVILKTLVQQFLECVRATYRVYRHGGDEFVILLSAYPDDGDTLDSLLPQTPRFTNPWHFRESAYRFHV